jgi:thiol-disulfide isomerase/thioredoxin
MSFDNEQEDVWVHVGVPVPVSGEEEDGVMVEDVVTMISTEHCEDRDELPATENWKEEEIMLIGTDLLWLLFVCLMLASTLWSVFLSAAPCISTVSVQRHVMIPTKSISTVVHEKAKSSAVSLNALNFDDIEAQRNIFFGVAPVRTSHLKVVEVAPVVLSTAGDAKKGAYADADNEAHMDGIAEATTIDKGKSKAVTKRAGTGIQETTKGVGINRKVDKKHASHKTHTGERLVAGGTLQQARSTGGALSEHALIPTPANTVKAGGAIPSSRSAGGSKEPKLADVHAPIKIPTKKGSPAEAPVPLDAVLEGNIRGQVPVLKPIENALSVTDTKKQGNAGMSVGGGGQHPAFIKKTPPSFQVATRVLAGAQIPAAVDTSREIPVVDRDRMTRTMQMQEAPVMAEPDVVVLTKENFRSFLSSNKFAFVVFHGPDCDDCDKLTTEWDIFAQQAKKDHLAVTVGKVDCTQDKSLCDTSMTTTFPSFRWYQNAVPLYGYYRNYPRTSEKFLAYAKTKIYVATSDVKK